MASRLYTVEDYRKLPEDVRCELLEGELVMVPSPGFLHQAAVVEIGFAFREYARKTGAAFAVAPLDVWLSEHTVVQPDVVLIKAENRSRIAEDGVHGPPDLVVEVLSPSSRDRDTVQKLRIYEAAGVPEYWVVDPVGRWAEQYVRQGEDRGYRLVGRFTGKVVSVTLPELVVMLGW